MKRRLAEHPLPGKRMRQRFTRWFLPWGGLIPALLLVLLAGFMAPPALAANFVKGDVFAAISNGSVDHFSSDGTFIETLSTGLMGYTTGMAFDSTDNLYVTLFSASKVFVFQKDGTPKGTFGAGYSTPESIAFDKDGKVYVGNLFNGIRLYDPAGNYLRTIINIRVDWFDITADNKTIYFTQEGRDIKTVDIATGQVGPNFTTGTATRAFALRILPDGGVLLADQVNVKRYDSTGRVSQTYDVPFENSWFSLNLDPDGTSFWSGNYGTGKIYKFDITTGRLLQAIDTKRGANRLYGLVIFGELTAAKRAATNVRVIDTIATVGNELDVTSFSKPPSSIVTETNKTIIEWKYDTFSIGQIEDLSFEVILKNPIPGESRLVNEQLELIYTDVNGNPVRAELGPQYVQVLHSAFDSAIVTDKPSYQAHENVQISGSIKNLSGYSRTIDAQVLIEDSQGALVQAVATLSGLTFASGETKPVGPLLWNTGTTLAGVYQAHLILYESQKKVGEAVASFTIQPTIALTSKVTTDKMTYQAHEPVMLTATVTNASPNVILENVQAVVAVLDPAGAALFTDTRTIPLLVPGATSSYPVAWNTGASPPGVYTTRLEATHPLVSAQAMTTFTVLSSAGTGAGLVGTISPVPTVVYLGDSLTFNYTVKNAGNALVENLGLKVLLVDPATGQAVLTLTDSIAALGIGVQVSRSQIQNNLQVPLGGLPSKAFLVVLQGILSDGTTLPLASASVTVKAPQVDLAIMPADITFSNPLPLRGEKITITAIVRNLIAGAPPVANVAVAFYLGGLSGTKLGEQVIPSLGPSAPVAFLWDTAGLEGEQTIAVVVDPANTITEVSENNNVASQTITVQTLGLKKTAAASSRVLVWIAKQLGLTSNEETLARQALEALGLPYTVVHSKEEFAAEFRKPLYGAFLLFNQGEPLTDQLDQELQEQVNWGKGLVATFWEQTESGGGGAPLRILGVQFNGYLSPAARTLELLAGPLGPAQSLPTEGKVEKLTLPAGTTVQVVGTVTEKGTNYPAVLLQSYGEGEAVFFAVDMGASAQGAATASYQALLQAALTQVLPTKLPLLPLGAVTITLEITTPAIPVDLKIEEPLPAGLRVARPRGLDAGWRGPHGHPLPAAPHDEEAHLYAGAPPDGGSVDC